jgi:hypothetical protein
MRLLPPFLAKFETYSNLKVRVQIPTDIKMVAVCTELEN